MAAEKQSKLQALIAKQIKDPKQLREALETLAKIKDSQGSKSKNGDAPVKEDQAKA